MSVNKKYDLSFCCIKFILLLLIFTCSVDVNAQITRRAAFDFGSGKIKLQVADVDTDNHSIVQSIYSESVVVTLSEDAEKSPQGLFSDEMQKKAMTVTQNLKQKAIDFGAVEFTGIATQAYRKAPNGYNLINKYFSELNIPVKIISQVEEGEIGFFALIAERNLDPSHVSTCSPPSFVGR